MIEWPSRSGLKQEKEVPKRSRRRGVKEQPRLPALARGDVQKGWEHRARESCGGCARNSIRWPCLQLPQEASGAGQTRRRLSSKVGELIEHCMHTRRRVSRAEAVAPEALSQNLASPNQRSCAKNGTRDAPHLARNSIGVAFVVPAGLRPSL